MYRNRSHSLCAAMLPLAAALLMVQQVWGITPIDANGKAPFASSFSGPLWQVVAPAGGIVAAVNEHLMINVPGGSNHDALHGVNQAVRVLQPIGDVDFDVAIKVDSPLEVTGGTTSQGLMAVMDDKNYITFGLAADGTGISLSASSVKGAATSTLFNDRNFAEYQVPMQLRLKRTGATFVAYYSVDGSVWVQSASFVDARVPTWIGPFASNYDTTPAKAVPVVMAINWFNVF